MCMCMCMRVCVCVCAETRDCYKRVHVELSYAHVNTHVDTSGVDDDVRAEVSSPI